MTGTIRTYDAGVRAAVHHDIRQIAENIAASANAKAIPSRANLQMRGINRIVTRSKHSVSCVTSNRSRPCEAEIVAGAMREWTTRSKSHN
jgi:metal-dependent amidase/aminoacylase/carboxypeptidase family protein